MHGSLHLAIANQTELIRQAEVARLPRSNRSAAQAVLTRLFPRRARGASLPSRAAPGTDSPALGRPSAAFPRGR